MSNFPYQLVLFDLDGTVIDSMESIEYCMNKGFSDHHIPLPEGFDLKQLIGPPLREKLPTVLPVSGEQVELLVEAERTAFFEEGWKLIKIYPGIRTILKTLRRHGVHTAVVSNKTDLLARFLLEKYRLANCFDEVIAYSDAHPHDGKTEMIRRAVSQFDGKAVMLGDRFYDILGACENRIDSIGIGYGYGTETELREAGCTFFVHDTGELYTLLCGDTPPEGGFFLSAEGPDGSGKSTQLKLLKEKLLQYGFDLYCTREPGGCPISEQIRGIVLDNANMEMCDTCEALLYAAARAQHVHEVIEPRLREGKLVLSDRFVDSSVAYQGGARGLGIEKVQAINAPAVDGCMPDATLYLSISAEKALQRRYSASLPDRLELEALSFHHRVTEAYEEIIRRNPERFLVIDADRDADSIAQDAFEAVLNRIEPCGERKEEPI